MLLNPERVTRLKASRQAAGGRKLAQVHSALAELERSGTSFANAELARVAKVSRRFIYDHPELRAEVDRVRARSVAAATSALFSGAT